MYRGRFDFVGENAVLEREPFYQELTLYEDEAQTDPLDLTGFTARFFVSDGVPAILLNLNTTNGGIVLGGALGTIVIDESEASPAIPSANQLPKGDYRWTLEVRDTTGKLHTRVTGAYRVIGQLEP